MEAWDKSQVDFFGTGEPDLKCPARVTLNGLILRVVVTWKGRNLSYGGKEVSPGFFKLRADHGGYATLHRRPDIPELLEGSWTETAPRGNGMWMLLLDRDE